MIVCVFVFCFFFAGLSWLVGWLFDVDEVLFGMMIYCFSCVFKLFSNLF